MKKRVRLDTKDLKDTKDLRAEREEQDPKHADKALDTTALEDEAQNEGFSEWLRSSSGVELMRLFVIANSTSVWKMIDVYFKNRFQSYLRAEYDKNPQMLADIEAYRAAVGKEVPTVPITEPEEHLKEILNVCSADDCVVNNEDDSKMRGVTPAATKDTFDETNEAVQSNTAETTKSPPIVGKHESIKVEEPPETPSVRLKKDSVTKENDSKKRTRRTPAVGKVEAKKATKNRLKTITLTEKDFASTKIKVTAQDFAEFDVDEDAVQGLHDEPNGVPISELPFKLKADIGNLQIVYPDEFCPLTLEDKFSCDETKTWP